MLQLEIIKVIQTLNKILTKIHIKVKMQWQAQQRHPKQTLTTWLLQFAYAYVRSKAKAKVNVGPLVNKDGEVISLSLIHISEPTRPY